MNFSTQIILTCNYSPWSKYSGGGQKSTHELANALSNLGYDVKVVYSKSLFEKISPKNNQYKVHWTFFWAVVPGISSPFRFLNGISYFFTVLRISNSETIIHSNGEEGSLLGYIPRKKRFIVTNRYPRFDPFLKSISWHRSRKWIQLLLKEPRFAALYLSFVKSDVLTCTSEYSKNHLSEFWSIPKHKINVIYNGIDSKYFCDVSVKKNKKGFLFFGRLTKAKGIIDVIMAFSKLPNTILQSTELDVVGKGPLKNELLALVKKLKLEHKINFIPWAESDEIVELIAKREVCVLPSIEESFGNTMVECLAAGGTLVSSKAGSIPEIVREFGNLVPVGDTQKLVEAMEKAFLETRNVEDISKQKKYVKDAFSWETTAKEFVISYGVSKD